MIEIMTVIMKCKHSLRACAIAIITLGEFTPFKPYQLFTHPIIVILLIGVTILQSSTVMLIGVYCQHV